MSIWKTSVKMWTTWFWTCESWWVIMINCIVDTLWSTSFHLLPTESAGASLHLLLWSEKWLSANSQLANLLREFWTNTDRLACAAVTLSMCGWLAAEWMHSLFYLFPRLPAIERRLFCAEQKSYPSRLFQHLSFFQHLSTFNCLLIFAVPWFSCIFLRERTDQIEKGKSNTLLEIGGQCRTRLLA